MELKSELSVSTQIRLKQVEPGDAERIFRIIDRQRDYLGRWLPFVACTERPEDTLHFIRSLQNPLEPAFGIHYEDELVGMIGFHSADKSNLKLEIGYWLEQSAQKQGIVTQSVQTLLDYVFRDWHFNSVRIRCATENLVSKRIPQRLGFVSEGIERQGLLLANGRFADVEIYSMLAGEWAAKTRKG